MDIFSQTARLLNLHTSIIVFTLSIVMLCCIRREHKYIKTLKNGRKQLFMALLGIFMTMSLRSIYAILSYFFDALMKPTMHPFVVLLNLLSIGILGNFIVTKWKIAVDAYVSEDKKGKNENTSSKK